MWTQPQLLEFDVQNCERWLRATRQSASVEADGTQVSETVVELLWLLRILYGFGRTLSLSILTRSSAHDNDNPRLTIAPSSFVSNHMTGKLLRQLQEAVVVCTQKLPRWLDDVLSLCSFLLPFESRRLYYFATAFGSPVARTCL